MDRQPPRGTRRVRDNVEVMASAPAEILSTISAWSISGDVDAMRLAFGSVFSLATT